MTISSASVLGSTSPFDGPLSALSPLSADGRLVVVSFIVGFCCVSESSADPGEAEELCQAP